MSDNILNMFCCKCNHRFAINLPKCPDCGEPVTEETKETLIHWASFGILIGVGAIVLAAVSSFPDNLVYRIFQIILIILGPILIFSGLRQFLSSRGRVLRRGLGSSLNLIGLVLITFFGWMANVFFRNITTYAENSMMFLGLILIGIGLWQFITTSGRKPQNQSTTQPQEPSLLNVK